MERFGEVSPGDFEAGMEVLDVEGGEDSLDSDLTLTVRGSSTRGGVI
jgi:hypothetical protein